VTQDEVKPTALIASVVTEEITSIVEAIVVATLALQLAIALHATTAEQLAARDADETTVTSEEHVAATLRVTSELPVSDATHSRFATTECSVFRLPRKKKKLIRFYPGT
jgi:2-methylaconitate cis-trans-isomerase PrpF